MAIHFDAAVWRKAKRKSITGTSLRGTLFLLVRFFHNFYMEIGVRSGMRKAARLTT